MKLPALLHEHCWKAFTNNYKCSMASQSVNQQQQYSTIASNNFTLKHKTKIDPEDLAAFDNSFSSQISDDDEFFRNLKLTPQKPVAVGKSPVKTSPVKRSPVKPENIQFEADFEFDSDFEKDHSQELDSDPDLDNFSLPTRQRSANSTQNKSFSKTLKPNSFLAASTSSQDHSNHTSIPSISSPSYHRYETLYPKINPNLNSSPILNRVENTKQVINKAPSPLKTPRNGSIFNENNVGFNEINDTAKPIYPINELNEYKKRVLEHQEAVDSIKKHKDTNSRMRLLTQRPPTFVAPSSDSETGNNSKNDDDDDSNNNNKTKNPTKAKVVQPIVLSEEQEKVLEIAKSGKSLFYTGSAGTGKSVLLRTIIKELKAIHPSGVAVTASTGLAACNIGGVTLHSFAGIGIGNQPTSELVKRIKRSKHSAKKWVSCKVLIIDEISMIDADLFDKLDQIARTIRRNKKPFGGIQLIICGDFFQLPPVPQSNDVDESKNTEKAQSKFCFESKSWKEAIELTIILQKIFRQKGDVEFITMLNELRLGQLTTNSISKFIELERDLKSKKNINAAELFCTRAEVERANQQRLKRINAPLVNYKAIDKITIPDQTRGYKLLSNFLAPESLDLKVGAQVMLVKNIDENLVNGSLGKVLDFICKDTYMSYAKLEEYRSISDKELIDYFNTKPSSKFGKDKKKFPELEESVFEFMNDYQEEEIENNPELKEFIKRKQELMKIFQSSSTNNKLPLVKFLTPDGSSRTMLLEPEEWTVEDHEQQPLVSRTQIPLILAWAISIHKSQGQTLPLVKVDLRRTFEKGQAYVALSRAVSRQGLQVLNFDPQKVWAHSKVIEFYKTLKNVDDFADSVQEASSSIDIIETGSKHRHHGICDEDDDDEDFVVPDKMPIDTRTLRRPTRNIVLTDTSSSQ